MGFPANRVSLLSQARAFSEVTEQVKTSAEKSITKNGESYSALIDFSRLDNHYQLVCERIHLLIIDEASKGLDDLAAGKVKDAHSAIQSIKRRRKT